MRSNARTEGTASEKCCFGLLCDGTLEVDDFKKKMHSAVFLGGGNRSRRGVGFTRIWILGRP